VTADEEDGRVRRAAERRSRRRVQLLQAAQRVFSNKGYHATSVADILAEASASRGTFYLYFPSKWAVFEALLEQMFQHISRAVRRVRVGEGSEPVVDQMNGNVCRVLDVVHAHRELTIILLREAVALDIDLDRKVAAFYGRLCQLVEGGLTLGQSMGLVRACDTRMVAHCVLGSMKEVVLDWLTASDPLDRDELAREILAYNLHGIYGGTG